MNNNHVPVATPRNILQKLTEEQPKDEEIVESKSAQIVSAAAETVASDSPPTSVTTDKESGVALPKLNVSKVMLNVDDTTICLDADANESVEHIFSHKIIQTTHTPTSNGVSLNVSRTQINGMLNELISSTPKKKSISVVELNVDHSDATEIENQLTDLEHAELSKEVKEIIDKAIEVNEARLSAAITGDDWLPGKVDEVNNNNFDAKSESPLWIYTLPAPPTFADGKAAASKKLDEKCTENDSGVCAASPKGSLSSEDESKGVATAEEHPIKPIICEKSPIDFQIEISDNSLPTSSSTYGTMSTEPESLRTSDIEDGYKGNSNVNGVEFVEQEFEFLAHERYDEPSSTKKENGDCAPPKIAGSKANVIEELTTIISAKRLDTVIKPSDNDNDDIDATSTKRSTLSNFQIGSYTNNASNHHENVCTKSTAAPIVDKSPTEPRHKRRSLAENLQESNENGVRRSSTTSKRVSLTNGLGVGINADGNNVEADTNIIKGPKYVSRSKSFHSTLSWSAVRNANAESRFDSLAQTPPRSTSYISLNGTQRGLTDATRQRSSSELSIADSPSLQSVEVLKSIMNGSRKNSICEQTATMKMNFVTANAIEKASDVINAKHDTVADQLPVIGVTNGNAKPKIEPKTWKYEGPPSINLSTWGERPKSQVFIKSDSDYKFGGMSKIAALQKRFSAAIAESEDTKQNAPNESNGRKLPIVRGVEYKRATQNGNGNVSIDAIDSEVELRPSRRPSYEISRIVSDKPITNYSTMTLGRVTSAAKNDDLSAKKVWGGIRSTNTNTNGNAFVQRVVSFNGNAMHAPVVKGFKAADIVAGTNNVQNDSRKQQPLVKLTTYETEPPPPFSQFTLRKTGLKEKILVECNSLSAGPSHSNVRRTTEETMNKCNTTAPKPPPPPISQKPTGSGRNKAGNTMHRSQSMPAESQIDPRNQLLDSIRNFNLTALKKY